MTKRDPVEARADASRDLYDISTWEPRTRLDRFAAMVYGGTVAVTRAVFVLLALLIVLAQFLLGGIGATLADQPAAVWLVALSVIPAFALVWYVYRADVTGGEPLELLVGTFVLGVLFAGFAAVINSFLQPALRVIPVVGMVLFFYLVVGPVEETVKWLAVRLLPYRNDSFDAVVDGAVYGAAAGLGFAMPASASPPSRTPSTSPGTWTWPGRRPRRRSAPWGSARPPWGSWARSSSGTSSAPGDR